MPQVGVEVEWVDSGLHPGVIYRGGATHRVGVGGSRYMVGEAGQAGWGLSQCG